VFKHVTKAQLVKHQDNVGLSSQSVAKKFSDTYDARNVTISTATCFYQAKSNECSAQTLKESFHDILVIHCPG